MMAILVQQNALSELNITLVIQRTTRLIKASGSTFILVADKK